MKVIGLDGIRRALTVILDKYDAVDVVGHDNMNTQFDVFETLGQAFPFAPRNLAELIKAHFPISHLAKKALAPVCHDRHIIRARPGVIITRKADGATVV